MENFRVEEGWDITLDSPQCELRYEGCGKEATTFYRVHGCASYYACDSCNEGMLKTLMRSFHKFSDMYCKRCKQRYEFPGYVDVISLKEKE